MLDDTVIDRNFSHKIELVRRQYSSNAHRVIKGISVVNCVYVNPEIKQFWIIDFRIYDPEGDKKSKLNHVQDMLQYRTLQMKWLAIFCFSLGQVGSNL